MPIRLRTPRALPFVLVLALLAAVGVIGMGAAHHRVLSQISATAVCVPPTEWNSIVTESSCPSTQTS
jgi:hypothetical protein